MTPLELTAVAKKIVDYVKGNRIVKVKAKWKGAGEENADDELVEWSGLAYLDDDDTLMVAYDQGPGAEACPFPCDEAEYHEVSIATIPRPKKANNDAPVTGRIDPINVNTWVPYIEGPDDKLELLLLTLRVHFQLNQSTSPTTWLAWEALENWIRFCAETQGWSEGFGLECGKNILTLLRDGVTRDSGVDPLAVHKVLKPKLHPDDEYGNAVDQVKASQGKKASARPRVQCPSCGKFNHTEARCFKLHPELRPEKGNGKGGSGKAK